MPHVRNSFSLSGPSRALDPRVNAMRGDLADVALAGRHFSPHYARPVAQVCVAPFVALHDRPEGRQVSELLSGETFMMLDVSGGWAWGYCGHDHYVGYLEIGALAASGPAPTVLKAATASEAALTFLDMPYVWGGRGGSGIDCSGLVQRSLAAIGVAAPRDSDMQSESVGVPLDADDALRADDLVFFTGHVGIMIDADRLIHATQHFGRTVIEPLGDVAARAAGDDGGGILLRRRV